MGAGCEVLCVCEEPEREDYPPRIVRRRGDWKRRDAPRKCLRGVLCQLDEFIRAEFVSDDSRRSEVEREKLGVVLVLKDGHLCLEPLRGCDPQLHHYGRVLSCDIEHEEIGVEEGVPDLIVNDHRPR